MEGIVNLLPELKVFFVSIIPIVEMKGGIPIGVGAGVPVVTATVIGILGTCVQIPLNLLLIHYLVKFAHLHPLTHRFLTWSQERSHKHKALIDRWGVVGIAVLVGIPIPGTGLWTGTVAGTIIGLNWKQLLVGLILGTIIAGILIGLATAGVTLLF